MCTWHWAWTTQRYFSLDVLQLCGGVKAAGSLKPLVKNAVSRPYLTYPASKSLVDQAWENAFFKSCHCDSDAHLSLNTTPWGTFVEKYSAVCIFIKYKEFLRINKYSDNGISWEIGIMSLIWVQTVSAVSQTTWSLHLSHFLSSVLV